MDPNANNAEAAQMTEAQMDPELVELNKKAVAMSSRIMAAVNSLIGETDTHGGVLLLAMIDATAQIAVQVENPNARGSSALVAPQTLMGAINHHYRTQAAYQAGAKIGHQHPLDVPATDEADAQPAPEETAA